MKTKKISFVEAFNRLQNGEFKNSNLLVNGKEVFTGNSKQFLSANFEIIEECKFCELEKGEGLSITKDEKIPICEKHKKQIEEKKTLSDKIGTRLPYGWIYDSEGTELKEVDVKEAIKEVIDFEWGNIHSKEGAIERAKQIFGKRLV